MAGLSDFNVEEVAQDGLLAPSREMHRFNTSRGDLGQEYPENATLVRPPRCEYYHRLTPMPLGSCSCMVIYLAAGVQTRHGQDTYNVAGTRAIHLALII